MRSPRKFFTVAVVCSALALTIASSVPSRAAIASLDGATQQSVQNRLLTERSALMHQLSVLLANSGQVSDGLFDAEGNYQQAQQSVLAVRSRLAASNAQLSALAEQISHDVSVDAGAQKQLATLVRLTYERADDGGVVASLLTSQSISQAVSRAATTRTVQMQVVRLEEQLTENEAQLISDRATVQRQFGIGLQLESQLNSVSNQFMIAVAQRSSELAGASAPVITVESEIATIDNQLAGSNSTSPSGRISSAPCGDHFDFGECTYYVATRRCIPWTGNADQWYAAAAAMGYREGRVPVAGAVVVFPPGGDGAGPVGHVAYVEAVGPSAGVGPYAQVPAGEFEISEMNFVAWDQVSFRLLPDNTPGIDGFIYGHS